MEDNLDQNTLKACLENGMIDQCKYIICATNWMDTYFKHERNIDCLDFILETIGLELMADYVTRFDEPDLRFIIQIYPHLTTFYFSNGETIADRMYISARTIIELNCEYTEAILHNITTVESLELVITTKGLNITKFKMDGMNYLHNLFIDYICTRNEYKRIYKVCKYLARHHLSEFLEMINEIDTRGNTPLFYIDMQPVDNDYKYVEKIILLCKNHGGDLLYENICGVTFLGVSANTLYTILS